MKDNKGILNNYKIYLYIILIIIIIICIIGVVVVKYKYSDDNIDDDMIVDNSNKYNDITKNSWVRRNIEFYIDNKITSKVDNMFDKYIIFDKEFISYCSYENNECNKYNYKIDDEYLYVNVDDFHHYEYKINDDVLIFYVNDEEYNAVYYFVKPLG